MREPTSGLALYAWHRAAVAGREPPMHPDWPECGWFKMKMVKGAPWAPVEILIERDIDPDTGELTEPERVIAIVDGLRRSAESVWSRCTPITREEHAALLAMRETIPGMAATLAPLDLTLEPVLP